MTSKGTILQSNWIVFKIQDSTILVFFNNVLYILAYFFHPFMSGEQSLTQLHTIF